MTTRSAVRLTADEARAVHDAIYHFGSLVPAAHTWTAEERRLWERADAILRRARKTNAVW
jgi:hypothetical protein